MKRFILSVINFTLLVIPGYIALLYVFGIDPKTKYPDLFFNIGNYSNSYPRLREINKFRDVDILFLGSSHAYRGFDVRVFEKHGFYTFNLGSSAQTPIQTQLLLNRYLNLLNPKLIVYAVSPGIFNSDGLESAIDIISNDKNDMYSFNMVLKIKNLKLLNTFIYWNVREFLNLNLNSNFQQSMVEYGSDYIDTYISGGYVERNTNIHYNSIDVIGQNIETKFVQYQLNIFNEIINDARNRQKKIVLIRTPVGNYNLYNNSEFNKIMQQYGYYYDFNNILNFTDNCFYDTDHLRREYVEIFSNKVADLIVSLDILN